jgi:molecular chaperone GrpE
MTDDDTIDGADEYEGLSEVDEVTPEEAQVDGLALDGSDEPAEAAEFVDAAAAVDGESGDVPDEVPGSDTDGDTDAGFAADAVESEQLAEAIDTEIHELAAERDQFKDIALRLQADFDNYRKRMSVQTAAEVDRATGKLAEALLPVLDAAEAAYVQHPDEVGPLLNLMLAELRKHGLESIDLLDKPFDPNLADAVAHEPGEGGDPVVAEVLRSGYSWNGRTLRPAMVRTRD